MSPLYPTSPVYRTPPAPLATPPAAPTARPSSWIAKTTSLLWTNATVVAPDARPQLVFIGDLTSPEDASRESTMFALPRMQLAARAFRHLAVTKADAARDPRLVSYAPNAPVLLIMTPDAGHAFELHGTSLTATEASEKMRAVVASVSTDDLTAIVDASERTQAAITAVDEEIRGLATAILPDADRRDRLAAAARRRDALVVEFRERFVLHPRTVARS